jgi:hypothetical protein
VAGEDLALCLLRRLVAPAHLFLEPERQAHLLQLAEELVRRRYTQDRGEKPRGRAGPEEGIAVLVGGHVGEEVAADELLRERRATLGEEDPEPRAALPPCGQRVLCGFLDDPGKGAVLHAGMGQEVLVLGGQDRLAHDEGYLVVGDHPAVLPCELDQHLALGVVDLTGRGGLEADERVEVGEAAPVEVHEANEPRRGQERDERPEQDREAYEAARPGRPQAVGYEGAGTLRPASPAGGATA